MGHAGRCKGRFVLSRETSDRLTCATPLLDHVWMCGHPWSPRILFTWLEPTEGRVEGWPHRLVARPQVTSGRVTRRALSEDAGCSLSQHPPQREHLCPRPQTRGDPPVGGRARRDGRPCDLAPALVPVLWLTCKSRGPGSAGTLVHTPAPTLEGTRGRSHLLCRNRAGGAHSVGRSPSLPSWAPAAVPHLGGQLARELGSHTGHTDGTDASPVCHSVSSVPADSGPEDMSPWNP